MSQDPFVIILEEAEMLYERGKYGESLELLRRAEQEALDNGRLDELATIYIIIGNNLIRLGDFEKAKKCYEISLGIYEQFAISDMSYNELLAKALVNLSVLFGYMGRWKDAKPNLERALKLREALLATHPENRVYKSDVAMTLHNLATLLNNMGRLEEAKSRYERTLEMLEPLFADDPENNAYKSDVAMTLNNLGLLLNDMGRLEEAKSKLEHALEIREAFFADDPENSLYKSQFARTLDNLAIVLRNMGRLEEGKSKFEHAFEIRESLLADDPENSLHKLDVAMTLHNLATLLNDMGKLEEAKQRYERALELRESLFADDPENNEYKLNAALTLDNLGLLLIDMGRLEEGKSKFERAFEIRESLLDDDPENRVYKSDVAMTLHNLATLLNNMGRLEEAKQMYECALELRESLFADDPENNAYKSNVAMTLNNLGLLLIKMERLEEAKSKLEYSLEIREAFLATDPENSLFKEDFAGTLNNIGVLLQHYKDFSQALDYPSNALNIVSPSGNPDQVSRIFYSRGSCYEKMDKFDKAYEDYRESIERIEQIRSQFSLEEHKLDIMRNKEAVYSDIISLLCTKMNDVSTALEYVGRAKSRTLLEYLRFIELPAPQNIPKDLLSIEKMLLESIRALDRQARMAEKEEQKYSLSQEIKKKESELNALYNQIMDLAPDYIDLRKGQPLLADEITDLINNQGKKTAFVEYYTTPEKIFIFFMLSNDSKPKVKIVDISSQQLTDYVKRYIFEIIDFPPKPGMLGTEETWQELAEYLMPPEVFENIHGCEMLYLIPHGLLHYLPIHALSINDKRLIEYFPIAYVSSLTAIKYAQRKGSEKFDSCLSMGFTLKENEKELFEGEASLVANLFKTEAYLNKKATSQLLTNVDMDVVHISCHGKLDSQEPLNSRLVLYDKILTVKDIFNMSIKANLLVLSACETGLNQEKPGDELIGFTRAFLYSGIKSLMVSLWSASPDSTLKLMEKFYKNIKNEKMSKAEALQKAQIEVMRDEQYSHPYYWASFILIGDWK